MRLISCFAAVLVFMGWPMCSYAADARAQLNTFVTTVKSATGFFTQVTRGTQGRDQPEQTGSFAFERPGKFKWVVEQPYEQHIVADGKRVFQYDPDLAQVTVRSINQIIGASPAAILFGSSALEQTFHLTMLSEREGLQWLRAKPRNADAGFSQVDIGLKDNLPVRIELLDAFGQMTQVCLSGIRLNPPLASSEFEFTPPKGVDVVQM
jgi:outer membrane lipoprotein carrier protein